MRPERGKGQVNEAEVDLGANPGTLRVQGDYDQTAAGTLGLKVGGTTAGTTYDQLIVSGTATLNGTLALTLLNNFTPKPGEAFSIMDFRASVGAFTNVMGPLSGGTPIFLLKFYNSLPGQAGGGVMAVVATPEPSIPSKLTLQTAGESLSAPTYIPISTLPSLPAGATAVLANVTEFTVSDVIPGGSATVVIQLPAATLQPNTAYAYFKYVPNNPSASAWIRVNPGVAAFDVAQQTITLNLKDDGIIADGDEDAANNGDIHDPGMPVMLATSTVKVTSSPTVKASGSAQMVTLTAQVSSLMTVTTGTVTFTIQGLPGSAEVNVDSTGKATVLVTVPAGTMDGQYKIIAVYAGDTLANSSSNPAADGTLTVLSTTPGIHPGASRCSFFGCL